MRSIQRRSEVLLVVDVPALAGRIQIAAHLFSIRYVLIPWVGVMSLGFAFGKLLLRPDRRQWILTLGILRYVLVLRSPRDQSLRERIAGLPLDIHGLPDLGCSADAVADGNLVFTLLNIRRHSTICS